MTTPNHSHTNILKMGEPLLITPSRPVDLSDLATLTPTIELMKQAMAEYQGVGIAAPQVNINKRIIMFGFDHNPRYPNEKPVPFTILINPTYEPLTNEIVAGWEGCLSIPGIRGSVPRFKSIRYQGYDLLGNLISSTAHDFHARVVQHECDHVNGFLFPQRMTDFRQFGFEEVLWKKIHMLE